VGMGKGCWRSGNNGVGNPTFYQQCIKKYFISLSLGGILAFHCCDRKLA
jgi:hypothetical protein